MKVRQIKQALVYPDSAIGSANGNVKDNAELSEELLCNSLADGWEILDKSILCTRDVAMIVWTITEKNK